MAEAEAVKAGIDIWSQIIWPAIETAVAGYVGVYAHNKLRLYTQKWTDPGEYARRRYSPKVLGSIARGSEDAANGYFKDIKTLRPLENTGNQDAMRAVSVKFSNIDYLIDLQERLKEAKEEI